MVVEAAAQQRHTERERRMSAPWKGAARNEGEPKARHATGLLCGDWLVEPEAEVVVLFVGTTDRHVLTGDIEPLAAVLRIETVVEEKVGRLYTPIKAYLIVIATEEPERTAAKRLYGRGLHHAVLGRNDSPGAVNDVVIIVDV